MKRNQIIFLLYSVVLLFITYIYFDLQILNYQKFNNLSGKNSLRKIIIESPRGLIMDRNKTPLVDNRYSYKLKIIPHDAKNFNYNLLFDIYQDLNPNIIDSINNLQKTFYRFMPITISNEIDFKTKSIIEENRLEFPGLLFSNYPRREYLQDVNLSHVLGYLRVVNKEMLKTQKKYLFGSYIGSDGLEKRYENVLKGKNGYEYHLVDIYGIDYGLYNNQMRVLPQAGDTLTTTIDLSMQILSEQLIDNYNGAIICMNPKNGDILSYVSKPDYNLNLFNNIISDELWNSFNADSNRSLLNRPIQGLYPPGSIVKLVSAIHALESDLVEPDNHVFCNGKFSYGDRVFHCWKEEGHGEVDLEKSISESCNIYFYELGTQMSIDGWHNTMLNFNFGQLTNIDLPGEKVGIVPSENYLNDKYGTRGWGRGNLLNFVIGQGELLATPIQMIHLLNIIVNEGIAVQPRLLMNKSEVFKEINIKKTIFQTIKNSLIMAVESKDGTAQGARIKDIEVGGKTGTSQNPHGEHHSIFLGFLQMDDTILTIVVLVENGGLGSGLATQIARRLFKHYIK